VVTHQPVFVTHAEDEEHLLRGHQKAVAEWAQAGVDLILGGHIHRPFISGLHDRFTSLQRPAWVVQAGTAVSTRIRHDSNNSVYLIRHGLEGEARHCEVERWDYDEDSSEFAMIQSQALQIA
ncbi:MAG TPA: DNA repair exonuclease, partial [Pusillimonas sp.]|nr:DNA repair exonuclease [Pusillimonas sp.]